MIEAATLAFETAAINNSLHIIKSSIGVGADVSTDEMVKVYNDKFAKEKQPGRPIYEKLRSASENDLCPLCAQRDVGSLDHYLPKADFPILAITPINLVPACISCNKIKLKISSSKAEEQTLHPYFDDVESELWLKSEVQETLPASFKFFVDPPSHWDAIKKSRVKYHFKLFKLAKLYTSNAAGELGNIRQYLINLHTKAGVDGVQAHLQEQVDSRYADHINSWQTSIYQAMASSSWFCNGGFRKKI